MIKTEWTGVIGLMSGTSLDGLDICFVEFAKPDNTYLFRNMIAETIPYTEYWSDKLKHAFNFTQSELDVTDDAYGIFLGTCVTQFIQRHNLKGRVGLVASHGHTIFHQPQKKYTLQIGSGNQILKITGLSVINNFRVKDVQLGGQGAPLVPVGDHYLFSEYDSCLNLGGFSNISFVSNNQRIAFDISPCNLPLNELCQRYFHCSYDKNGALAASGNQIDALFDQLNELTYYHQNHPKSLGYEWLNEFFYPVLKNFENAKPNDILNTLTAHIGYQINRVISQNEIKQVLVTGGGAYNNQLIKALKSGSAQIIIPDAKIVEFKEALIFAFLGYLNLNNTINTFKSVTGASEDSIGGVRHF